MNRAIDGTPDLMSGRRASLRPTIFSSGHHHIPACRAQTRRTSIICFPVGQKKTFCLQNIKEQRADEGGAKEVRMMIMGPDPAPAQDNLTVNKLLSDTGACDSACGGIVWFFTVKKTRPGVWQLSMMRGGWTSAADNLPITREPSCSCLGALA